MFIFEVFSDLFFRHIIQSPWFHFNLSSHENFSCDSLCFFDPCFVLLFFGCDLFRCQCHFLVGVGLGQPNSLFCYASNSRRAVDRAGCGNADGSVRLVFGGLHQYIAIHCHSEAAVGTTKTSPGQIISGVFEFVIFFPCYCKVGIGKVCELGARHILCSCYALEKFG